MAREVYITEVVEIAAHGDCVRCDLLSGGKHIVLRGSVHTLTKALELGKRAVEERTSAKVVDLPKHG